MSCSNSNSFCNTSGSSNSNKKFRLYQESIVGENGVNREFKFDLCHWVHNYSQYNISSMVIKTGQINQVLNWGDGTTLAVLDIQFDKNAIVSDTLHLKMSFESDDRVFCIPDLWLQRGTATCPVPGVRLSNMSGYDAKVNILTLTDSMSSMIPITSEKIVTKTFDDLIYKSLRTHNSDYIAFWSLNSGGNPNNYYDNTDMTPLIYLSIDDILSLELQGRFIIVEDSAVGKIYFGFNTDTNAKQILSELTYLLNNRYLHNNDCPGGYTLPLPLDSSCPIVNWTSAVISHQLTLFLDSYINGYITYDEIIEASIENVIDDRDGIININISFIQIQALSYQDGTLCPPEDIPNAINKLGTYKMTIDLVDIAGNACTDSIEIKVTLSEDVVGPQLNFNSNYIPDNNGDYTIIYLDNYEII